MACTTRWGYPLSEGDKIIYDLHDYGIDAFIEGRIIKIIDSSMIWVEWDDDMHSHHPWYSDRNWKITSRNVIGIISGMAPDYDIEMIRDRDRHINKINKPFHMKITSD